MKTIFISLITFLSFIASGELNRSSGACLNGLAAHTYQCRNVNLSFALELSDFGQNSKYASDIWGWTDPESKKEYGIMVFSNKTVFVDVTTPEAPIALAWLNSRVTGQLVWRDVKVYKNHAYIVSELYQHGMQVIDLTKLRDITPEDAPVELESDHDYLGFGSSHNIAINEDSGYAYAVGTDTCDGGLHVIDIRSPKEPRFVTCVGRGIFEAPDNTKDGESYTHDVHCVIYQGPDKRYSGKEICACSNEDSVNIVDVTDKSNIYQISAKTYRGVRYTHQGWFSEDHKYFFLGDELDEINYNINTKTYVWDFTDLENIDVVNTFSFDTRATDHNLYVKGDYLYLANYDAGLRILDIKDPLNLREVGFLDTVPDSDRAGFRGLWSLFPYFESGTVIGSNMDGKFFVTRPEIP